MKPDWDRLMKEYADDKTKGIFEVDCTAAGKPLCDTDDVFYLPTIKSGDPNNLDEYRGGRDYDSFKSHAEGLKPFCSPSQPNFCDKQQLTLIEKLQTLGKDGIEALIAESKKSIADAEQTFKDEMSKLQSAYKQLMQEKDDVIAAVKSSGMGMAKSVLASLWLVSIFSFRRNLPDFFSAVAIDSGTKIFCDVRRQKSQHLFVLTGPRYYDGTHFPFQEEMCVSITSLFRYLLSLRFPNFSISNIIFLYENQS